MAVSYPQKAIKLLAKHLKWENEPIPEDEIYVVWFCYILGGWKALLSTSKEDGKYYEVTHNKNNLETYIDVYTKTQQVVSLGG